MTVTADIRVGERNLLAYLFSGYCRWGSKECRTLMVLARRHGER
jgi:hypothetical protein